jgi:hypothetical protein
MQLRNYSEAKERFGALVGIQDISSQEYAWFRQAFNRRAQMAYASTTYWPRFLVVDEKRVVGSYGAVNWMSGIGRRMNTVMRMARDPKFRARDTLEWQWVQSNEGVRLLNSPASERGYLSNPYPFDSEDSTLVTPRVNSQAVSFWLKGTTFKANATQTLLQASADIVPPRTGGLGTVGQLVLVRTSATTPFAFTVNASTDVVSAFGHQLLDGNTVTLSSSHTLPAGLLPNTVYYVIDVVDGVSFKLSLSSGGSAVDITGTGLGTHTFLRTDIGPRLKNGFVYANGTSVTWYVNGINIGIDGGINSAGVDISSYLNGVWHHVVGIINSSIESQVVSLVKVGDSAANVGDVEIADLRFYAAPLSIDSIKGLYDAPDSLTGSEVFIFDTPPVYATFLAALTSTYGDGSGDNPLVPREWFEYCVHGAYADWLRAEGQTAKALAEDQWANGLLMQELDKAERSGSDVVVRLSTHSNRQGRN